MIHGSGIDGSWFVNIGSKTKPLQDFPFAGMVFLTDHFSCEFEYVEIINTIIMRKTITMVSIYFLGSILTICLLLVFVMWILSPGKADPITDADGNIIEKSISVIEKIMLGGIEQHLIIRGADSTKPVMLFLHGGPGSPEMAFMKHYNTSIEQDYVMVYWEQRGSGKSFSTDIPVESMTIEQLISDTRELSEYLAKRFNKDKIYLMGHSWGSLLGIMTAHKHPDLFFAYFGIGQVAHQYKAEKISFDWVMEQARERNDKKAIRRLAEMTFPDSLATSKVWVDFIIAERNYVNQYGGAMRSITGMWPLIKRMLLAKEYSLGDKIKYARGSLFSLEHLWADVINSNLFLEIDSMQVPVYVFQGVYDYQTPYVVAKDFFDQLKTPQKEFFTFQNSAHSPLMEEVDRFNSIVRSRASLTL